MREAWIESASFLCPICRRAGLRLGRVDRRGDDGEILLGSLDCAGCAAMHPIVDGIPLLVEDWVSYAAGERLMILRRDDLPEWTSALLDAPLGGDHAERIRLGLLNTYVAAHYGRSVETHSANVNALADYVEGMLSRHSGGRQSLGLDAGCAAGGFTSMLSRYADLAIGLDLHFERVREAQRHRDQRGDALFVVADAQAAPFSAAAFQIVLALNLIDSCARPRETLERLDTCLQPGGLLVLTTPYQYSSVYSDPQQWVSEEELLSFLKERYEILDEQPRLPWVLPISPRHVDTFLVHAVTARKRVG